MVSPGEHLNRTEDNDVSNEGAEQDKELLEAWWQLWGALGIVLDTVALEDSLFVDSCTIPMEEATNNYIMQDALSNSQSEDVSNGDEELCDVPVPSARNVLNAPDVQRQHVGSHEQQNTMKTLWELEHHLKPMLVASMAQKKVTDYLCHK